MHGDTFPRVPGLLAPTPEARRANLREQDALLRDRLAREEAAYRDPCPPVQRRDVARRPVRAGAA
ncbi:MAG TPA: hypothetical protein VJ506_06295 [Candidatus Limnocylindrales bacterium]|nr:hypothetical protein [Candidatus Limnocylindrales bacterium]